MRIAVSTISTTNFIRSIMREVFRLRRLRSERTLDEYKKHFAPQQWPLVQTLVRLAIEEHRAQQMISEFEAPSASKPPNAKEVPPELPLDTPSRAPEHFDKIETSNGQLPRGLGFKFVEESLKSLGNTTITVKEMVRRVQRERGVKISYNSSKRALERLVKRGIVEQIPGTSAFRRPTKLRAAE